MKVIAIDALIDTGFTSFLALQRSTIESLRLPWHFSDVGTLGDGSEVIFEVYTGHVIWDGTIQVVDVVTSEAMPLVGMSLLYGFKLQVEAVEGGTVTIEAIRSHGGQFNSHLPYTFESTAVWPISDNYEVAIRESVEEVLLAYLGDLSKTHVLLKCISWDEVSSCEAGFRHAACAATKAVFEM